MALQDYSHENSGAAAAAAAQQQQQQQHDQQGRISLEKSTSNSSNGSGQEQCRICHLTERESGEKLEVTGCHCQGDFALVHTKCLQRWIDSRQNHECEICCSAFRLRVSTPPPLPPPPPPNHQHHHGGVPQVYLVDRACANTRRVWFVLLMTLLILTIVVCFILAARTASVTLQAYYSPNVVSELMFHVRAGNSTMNAAFTRQLSMSTLAFSCIIALVVVVLWMYAEVSVWPLEAQLLAVNRAQQRPQHFEYFDLQMLERQRDDNNN